MRSRRPRVVEGVPATSIRAGAHLPGRVISKAPKDRKRRQDLVDKRNKQLSEKIRNVKGVLDFSHKSAEALPRGDHPEREDKERRRRTPRYDALLDIYKTKE